MTFKPTTCYVLHCDGCGSPFEMEYVVHYDHDCVDDAEDYDWLITRDGKHFCPKAKCLDMAPPCLCPGENPDCSSSCVPGCPCVRHERIEPDGPCAVCGAVFERQVELAWHRIKEHRTAPSTGDDGGGTDAQV